MRAGNRGKRAAAALLAGLLLFALYGCGNQYKNYEKALAYFGSGEYAEAAEAFLKLGDYLQAETYAAYAQGLTYYEQGNYAAAEPYFAETQDFMYGKERYRVCHAYAMEEAEEFAQAALWYDALGEFEDAPKRAAYCRARAAVMDGDYETALINYGDAGDYADAAARLDALNFEIYDRATALMNDDKDYEQAFTLFTLLGTNYDAQEQARVCKNYFQDQSYAQAEALIAAGDLQGAYEAFSLLAGYRDAAARADELAAQLGIDTAAED